MTRGSCSSSSRSRTSAGPQTCSAPAYDASARRDGFVSFECTPDLADDTAATVEQAVELWDRLARDNVMIKVPATQAGVPAIEELTARGVNVNVTLLFSVARYEQVIDAYLAGLERRAAPRRPDRRDRLGGLLLRLARRRKTDALLAAGSDLRGRVAIANARLAYARYRERFADARWLALRQAGAQPQRPLWASTATKDPAYSDVLYVEELIAPDVINTMPEATLRAFADHGDATRALDSSGTRARGDAPPCRGRRHRPRRHHGRARARRMYARSVTPTATCSPASRASAAQRRPPRAPRGAPMTGIRPRSRRRPRRL